MKTTNSFLMELATKDTQAEEMHEHERIENCLKYVISYDGNDLVVRAYFLLLYALPKAALSVLATTTPAIVFFSVAGLTLPAKSIQVVYNKLMTEGAD